MKTLIAELETIAHQTLTYAKAENWEAVLKHQQEKTAVIKELEHASKNASTSEAQQIRAALCTVKEIESEIRLLAESNQKTLLSKSQKHIKSKNALKAYQGL